MEGVVDIKKSAKLQLYMDRQKLDLDDMNYIDKVDLSDLLLKSEFDNIKKQVERYIALKNAVASGEGDVVLMSDEMRNLSQNVLAETGRDINQIKLDDLETVTKLEDILAKSGIKSENNMIVVPTDDSYFGNSDYIKCTLHSGLFGGYGINQGARIAISASGAILTIKSALYAK